MHTHNVMHMHGLRSLSANGLSNINKIHIHNLCHHCHIHNVFHFRSVHNLFRYSIQSLSISLYLIFRLSLHLLSLQPHSPSLFRHVHYPPLFLSRSMFSLAHLFTLFCCGPTCLFLFLSISLYILCAPNQ